MAGNGAVGRGANECGLIAAATSAIATSAMILRNADLQIEYRGNSTPPERNMIAQRGVGIPRGRLFKCRRLSSALWMPRSLTLALRRLGVGLLVCRNAFNTRSFGDV